MENSVKFVLFAVTLIFVGILIANGVSVYTTGKAFLDLGKNMVTDSTSIFADIDKTQYEDSTVNGTQVVSLIKSYWKDANTVSILVCTKDGKNIMYDYAGASYDIINELTGFPNTDATGKALVSADDRKTVVDSCSKNSHEKAATFDENNGYKATSNQLDGYINTTSGIYQGKLQYDVNNNIRCITFVQTQ